jgi:trigger factor
MKSSIKKLEGTARELRIDLPKDAVDRAVEDVLEEVRKSAKIPGFRPGNAPMDIIRKNHGHEALEEAKQRLIPRAYQEVLEEHDIDPVSYPEIFDVDLNSAGVLSFKVKVDCHPEVGLKQYKGLKVEAKKVEVTDAEAEEALEKVRGMYAEFADIDRPLKKDDFAVSDVESFIDGKSISKKRENMWIEVSREASMLGIGEDLVGLKKGEVKEIEATLPEGYPDKKYAGKKAVFKVEVKQTKEKKMPSLDDELAKKVGKETLGELREDIKGQLLARKEENERISMKNQILEQLIKRHQFPLPATLVARQLKVLMERAENDLLQRGVEKDAIESHKDKIKDQLSKEAEDKVRVYFILDEVSKRENVNVTEEEIDSWISALAASYNKPFEEVKKYYQDNDLTGGLYEQLKEEKSLELLLAEAEIARKG